MEVQQGFSIREYVSRMRNVNVVKSWPFDETRSEESVESLLPPMTVQRFIWWADRLKGLSSKSDNKSSKKKKNVFGDSRTKAKGPKKKSILEIFAVAAAAEEKKKPTTKNKSKHVDWTKLKKTKDKVIQKNKKKRNLRYKDNCLAFKHQQDKARKISQPAECLNLQKFSCSDTDHKRDAGCVGKESNNVEASRSKDLKQNEEEPFCRSLTLDATLQGKNQDLLDLVLRQGAIDGNVGGPLPSRCSENFEVVMNSSGTKSGSQIKDLGTSHRGFPPLAPMEYLQTLCSLPECHHEGHIHQKLTMYGPRENLLGLPLNSKGEFITQNSTPKGDLNQMMKSSTSATASISLSPPRKKPFLDLEENALAFAPSRLDVTDSQDNSLPFHEVNPLYKNYNLFQKGPGNEKNMSKLRLMGKEFVVGDGLQDFEIGHRWKDKQVVDELHFSGSSASNVMMPYQDEVCIEKLRESYRTGSMHSFPHFEYSTHSMHQSNGFKARKLSAVERTESKFMPSSYNSVPHFPEPCPVEYRYQFRQGSCPTMTPTDFQLKHRPNLSHAPSSAIRFPLMPPDLGENCQSSLSWRSGMSNLQSSHTVDRCHHPFVMPGANHLTYPIMYREPETLCSYVPALFPPTLLSNQAPWMCYPGVIPVSSVQKCHGIQKIIIPRIRPETGYRDPGLATKATDQPPAASKYFEDADNTETAFRSCPAPQKSRILIHGEHRDDMRAHRVHPWSGPVKLTAGAKHILRSSQGMDQSSSRSTNPYNIPLVDTITRKAFQI